MGAKAGFALWMVLCAASTAASASPMAAATRQGAGGLRHEELARSFVRDLGGERPEAAPPLRSLLAERFVRLPLGAFELTWPAVALSNAEDAGELARVARALLDAQARWLDWGGASGEPAEAAQARLAALETWIEGWEPGRLRKLAGQGGDLLALLEAEAALQEASPAIQEALRALSPGAPSGRLPVRLMLLPSRALFVEFVCFAGWSRPELRGSFWVPGIETWTHTFLDDLRVYAMEYAAPGGGWSEGWSMSRRSETGLEEQMVQLAMGDLLTGLYGGRLPASFTAGLGTNLVIDLFGEVDTRIDGDLAGRTTQARETFVPGGLSYGGVLPTNRADSIWRQELGADYFIPVLRAAQQDGRKAKKLEGTRSPHPAGSFVLQPVGSRERYVVGAPILGPSADGHGAPPPAFEGEYQEFLRAYRSAFLHWLRTEGAGKEDASSGAFAELIAALAGRGELEEAFARIYGAPLSDPEVGKGSLEGRFLDWLAKQRGKRKR